MTKVVFVYGFCKKDDYSKAVSKILNLCRNLQKIKVVCDYHINDDDTAEYWKNMADLSKYTPDYVIGIDCEYNPLDKYERDIIKSHNKPTRIIRI